MFLLGTENIVGIVVVVCGKICGKICDEMCGKIEKLPDQNKIWCGTIYVPRDFYSGDIKTKNKGQKIKKTKRQKYKKAKDKKKKRQKGKKAKLQKY